MNSHTPTPWQIPNTAGKNYITASPYRSGSPCIATVEGISPVADDANAAFIVRAVNSHYELLHLMKTLVSIQDGKTEETFENCMDSIREAIAKAEGTL